MHPHLLDQYEQELRHIRRLAVEFAREHPTVAGRLGIEEHECKDPYVERLLEGFAYLTARVQVKLRDEFPRFTRHLLDLVCPHYLAPTPSMTVVQFRPKLSGLETSRVIPRGTQLRAVTPGGSPCDYRTAHDVVLSPVELHAASYVSVLDSQIRELAPDAQGAIRLTLRGHAPLAAIGLERLRLHIRGSDHLAARVYEALMGHAVVTVFRPSSKNRYEVPRRESDDAAPWVAAAGFDDAEALLPYGPRSFQGYRLLHEYFAFPSRFMFVDLCGLRSAFAACGEDDRELELLILLDQPDTPPPGRRPLEGSVDLSQFALHCTPAANLFPKHADAIHLRENAPEYRVVADRARERELEVHTVQRITGHGVGRSSTVDFMPLYAPQSQGPAYYTVDRRPEAPPPDAARSTHALDDYKGSQTYISLTEGANGPFRSDLRRLEIHSLCTNRGLPAQFRGQVSFQEQTGAPIESVACLFPPTKPRPSHAYGDVAWRLISHLSLNYLSLVDLDAEHGAPALRRLLELYSHLDDAIDRRRINGVLSVKASRVVRPLLSDSGPLSYGRGVEIAMSCDDTAFGVGGVFLFGTIMERFMARYVSMNTFTETVIHTPQRGEVMRWPIRAGSRQLQ